MSKERNYTKGITMGCDIHCYAEVKISDKWENVGKVFPTDDFYKKQYGLLVDDMPFKYRGYGLFGWLANVRNYSNSPYIELPKGFPYDATIALQEQYEEWGDAAHSASWLTLQELLAADYETVFFNARMSFEGSTTLRDFLEVGYFEVLDILKTLASPENVRIVFWFDN